MIRDFSPECLRDRNDELEAMNNFDKNISFIMKKLLLALITIAFIKVSSAQDTIVNSIKYSKPVNFTSQQNQDNMMQQLGIKKLRLGPSGNESAPNHANYDTTKQTLVRNYPIFLPQKTERKLPLLKCGGKNAALK